ncbi:MAG: hypothetical protein E7163_04485 [Firmicutes bacterium]|nr:hypothetical protein [Bacillota bacterium]
MKYLISTIIIMQIIAILEYKFVMKKSKKITELEYIKKRNKIKLTKKNFKRNCIIISLTNGLIIGLTSTLIFYSKFHLIITLPLGFILMIFLINIFYNHIIIKILK